MSEWKTAVTDIAANHIAPRGVHIEKLMQEGGFGGAVYLLLTGRRPDNAVAKLVDTILVSSIDHGVTPPSALAARNAASTGAPLNAAIASGVLAINRFHGGAIEGCMRVLQQVIDAAGQDGAGMDAAADSIIEQERAAGRRVPGFGHRVHTADPRTACLRNMARELGLSRQGMQAADAVAGAIARNLGKELPLNVDGAIAACLIDIGIDPHLANAFFIISRVPGLVAHAVEESSTQRPMRKIIQADARFISE